MRNNHIMWKSSGNGSLRQSTEMSIYDMFRHGCEIKMFKTEEGIICPEAIICNFYKNMAR